MNWQQGYDTAKLSYWQQGYDLLAVQCKMARAATGLGVRELAAAAGVSLQTVARLERGESLRPATLAAIRTALEAAGVEFTNGDQPGVRLRTVR